MSREEDQKNTDEESAVENVSLESQSWIVDPDTDSTSAAEPFWQSHSAKVRALLALIVMVIVSDLTVYRSEGFAGAALFLIVAPIILIVARSWSLSPLSTVVCGALLVGLTARLAWCGSPLAVLCGFGILVAFAMSLNSQKPFVLQTLSFGCLTVPYGAEVIGQLGSGTRSVVTQEPSVQRAGWLSVIIPMLAVGAFGTIFVLAKPSDDQLSRAFVRFRNYAYQWY